MISSKLPLLAKSFNITRSLRKKRAVTESTVCHIPYYSDVEPWYLRQYISRKTSESDDIKVVDKLGSEHKFLKNYSLIYPVGGGVFIHVSSRKLSRGYPSYVVIEPPRPPEKILYFVEEKVARLIPEEYVPKSPDDKVCLLLRLIDEVYSKWSGELLRYLSDGVPREELKSVVAYHVVRDKVGVGVIEPFLRDPYLEDISCSGLGSIYVVHKYFGSMESSVGFLNENELNAFLISLAEKIGKPLSSARPIVDATLPDGSRINIVFGNDVSLRGSNFTIRRVLKTPASVTQLISWGTFDARIAAYMWMLLSEGMSGFICGETASGKTTSLTAMIPFIRPSAKIVSIEDTAEVVVPHPNWVRELTRDTGRPESSVSMFDLLKSALRQRPNYIIVGEIRGAEGSIAFQAIQSVAWETPVLIKEVRTGRVKLVPIGEFVDKFFSDDAEGKRYVSGYEVLSLSKSGKVIWSPINYVLRHKTNTIYEIIYEGGGRLRVTGSHSVFVLDMKSMKVVPKLVSQLEEGDFLVSFVRNFDGAGSKQNASFGSLNLRELFLRPMTLWLMITSLLNTQAFKTLESLKASKESIIYYVSDEKVATAATWFARLLGFESYMSVSEGDEQSYEVVVCLPREEVPMCMLDALRHVIQNSSIPLNEHRLLRRSGNNSREFVSKKVVEDVIESFKEDLSLLNESDATLLGRIKTLLRSDLVFLKVLRIRKSRYDGFVYDISVPESELFLGGFLPTALHNTGHPVLSTFHASDIDTLTQRLTNNPINIPKTNIGALNFAWFQSAVYTKEGFLARKMVKLYEVIGYYPQNDSIIAIPVFVWDPVNDKFVFSGRGTSYLLEEKIAVMRGIPRSRVSEIYDELELRTLFIKELVEKKVFDYWDVWRAIIKSGEVGIEKAIDLLRKGALI
ncbi:MAG: ATPase, T2SS/T4P/T4SS family [Zestosphaera sp.]